MSTWSDYIDDYCESCEDDGSASITEPLDMPSEPNEEDISPDDFVTCDFFELETSKQIEAPEVYSNIIY